MLVFGASGSGIDKRTEKSIGLAEISLDNMSAAEEKLSKCSLDERRAILYVNSLIGIRKSEFLLFSMLTKHFDELAVVYDRLESLGMGDMETLQSDTCERFDLSGENIIFINKDESVEDAIKVKNLKFKSSGNIHLRNIDAPESLTVQNHDIEKNENEMDKDRVLSFIALAVMGLMILFMYFKKRTGPADDEDESGMMKTFLIPAGIFALTVALMNNKGVRDFVKKIY